MSRTLDVGSWKYGLRASYRRKVDPHVTLSLGLAIGMLIGSAPRLLIAIALAPLAAMGLVLADRRATAARASS